MIREDELLDAIAECQGERNPDAKTCIKLAAYYTILNNLYNKEEIHEPKQESYSYAPYKGSGSELREAVNGLTLEDVMPVLEELMETVELLIPKLYKATITRLKEL